MADWGGSRQNSGGRRTGAGRKKKQATIIREKAIEEAGADAEYALGLFVTWQKDETKDDAFRANCAREVLDRVWGKPTQRREHSGPDGAPLAINFVRRKDD